MNALFAPLLPWPYRVLAAILVAIALVATGYVKGRADEKTSVVRDNYITLTKIVEKVQRINAADRQIQAAYNKGKAEADADYQSSIERAAANANAIPDVPACDLDPRRVFNINAALGFTTLPRVGDPAGQVSGRPPVAER